jgi:cell division protein FtsI (penicillin-binding protein 3)
MIRPSRIGFAHATLAVFAIAILMKAASVQLVEGKAWRARAERQQTREQTVPAPRGEILDASGRVLAQSHDMVQLAIAPREVVERAKLRRALQALKVEPAVVARALDAATAWVVIPDRFVALDAAPATALAGVHATALVARSYSLSEGAQRLIGHVDAANNAVDGIELSLDSILRGTPGSATLVRDRKGQSRESPVAPGTPPTRGHTVTLSINADLQEIAETALAEAVSRMGAEGGDVVILDPHDGDVLAMASRRVGVRFGSATALTEPFEPGSTMKPFIAAGLLERGRVQDSDSVDTGNGVLKINGREIHDEHHLGKVPLADVLRWSSNIGIVKFATRLSSGEEFETLRDFGFGTATGVTYPAEASGTLRTPREWSAQSANSMAMGYEVAVTPLQLAVAYAAIANGGELLEPSLVKRVVSPAGEVVYRHTRRAVRRVMSRPVADKVRRMLLGVVDDGTALKAALDNYVLAGKTGTPRATVRGRYVRGRYNPNFVALFPGDNPQYVIVVKLTAPQGSYFGATTAAPVTKAVLEAAIAARDAALDRTKLASSSVGGRTAATPAIPPAPVGPDTTDANRAAISFVVTLPFVREPAPRGPRPRVVPDVHGLAVRDAVRSLHSAGFRVQLARGAGGGTSPVAGSMAPSGTLVRLLLSN